jgi:hypothetical protein
MTDDTARQELSALKFVLIWSHRMKLPDATVKRHRPIADPALPVGPLRKRLGLDRPVLRAVLDDE